MTYYGEMNAGWANVCTVAVVVIIGLITWAIVATIDERARRHWRDELLEAVEEGPK
jgi:hypothetical protein